MAQNYYTPAPRAQADPGSIWDKMIAQSNGLTQPDADLSDLSALSAMTPEPTPQMTPPNTPPNTPRGMPVTKVSQTIRMPVGNPEMRQANSDMLDLVKLYNQRQQEALDSQKQGVTDLSSRIQGIEAMPSNPIGNLRPLAQFYGLAPNSLPEAETPEARAQRLLGLQMELQKTRQGLSKEQADTLKDQIMALKATKDNSLQDALTLAKTNAFNNVGGRQQTRLDTMSYNQMLQDIKKDPNLNKNLTYYANLSNAMDNVMDPTKTPPQQLNELQQTIRGSTGLRGNSGIAERKADYLNFFGNDGTQIEQYITGKITSVPDSIKKQMVDHLGQIVEIEKKNLSRQQAARFDQLAGGQYSMLKRNPQYQGDLSSFRDNYLKSLNDMASQSAVDTPQVGQIEDGHKFLGGDASDPKNWEKMK